MGTAGMTVFFSTTVLLVLSNIFMTFAWYAHLKELTPGRGTWRRSRAGRSPCSSTCSRSRQTGSATRNCRVPQLKILQEVITLAVFAPFSLLYLREPLKLDYLWAGLCLCGAAFFMFRGWSGQG